MKSNCTESSAFDVITKSNESTFSLKSNVIGVLSINTIKESMGIEIESTLGGRISLSIVVSVYANSEYWFPDSSYIETPSEDSRTMNSLPLGVLLYSRFTLILSSPPVKKLLSVLVKLVTVQESIGLPFGIILTKISPISIVPVTSSFP